MNRNALILALSVGVITVSQAAFAAEPAKKAKGKPAAVQVAKASATASESDLAKWKNKPFVERFNHADTDGDGRLSQAEATQGYTPDLGKNFAAVDTNKDGMITLQERSAFNVRKAEHSAAGTSKNEPAHKAKGKPAAAKKG
jgi:EF hand